MAQLYFCFLPYLPWNGAGACLPFHSLSKCAKMVLPFRQFDTVFPACGSSNSVIEMTISEIYQISHSFGWVDVCKERLI